MTARRTLGLLAAALLIATVAIANYLTTRYHFVTVGFGLTAAAGTYAAGLALGLRDLVHDLLGRRAVIVVIVIGAAVSYLVADPFIALASGVAFLIAEAADFAVYVPLRRRGAIGGRRWTVAVVGSNVVGAVVDTVVFLALAFGWAAVTWPALAGQLVGKGWATLALIIVIGGVRAAALLRQPIHATDS
jgi:uncharacterized PurR-regulated membrane protein YhhQ (DUF165 family)